MSLYEKREGGILDTQVTWADLESNLRAALKTEAVFGPARSVLDIGEGNGMASRCGLVTCDWIGATDGEMLPETVVIKIARALGKIQAVTLKKDASAPELKTHHYADFAKTVSLEAFCGMFKGLLSVVDSEETRQLLKRLEEIVPEYYASSLAATIHKQLGLRGVLVNGDLRTENVLVDKDSGDVVSLIDWQCTHIGVGVQDLLRISLFALPAKERRESASVLVEEMYASMVANLDGAEPPYTLEKLQSLYDLVLPHSATYFAGGGVVIMNKQAKNEKLQMEEREQRKGVQLDKVIGAIEDILHYHDKNKEIVKELNLEFRDF